MSRDWIQRARLYASHVTKNALGYDRIMAAKWMSRNPFVGTEAEWGQTFRADEPAVGIMYDVAHQHRWYIQACHDFAVNYVVIDPRSDEWDISVREHGVRLVFVWPSVFGPEDKAMWDERVLLIADALGVPVYPDATSLWLYEGKRRIAAWLRIHGYPRVATHVFHDRDQAMAYVDVAEFPLVYKTDHGAAARGTEVLRSRSAAHRVVRQAFARGVEVVGRNRHARFRGSVLFQEYVDVTVEWRLIRVGDAYFCKRKEKVGDRFSGSGSIDWATPPATLLERTADLTERHGFRCLNVDWFELADGTFCINELHALWGNKPLGPSPNSGRYLVDADGAWQFEPGEFDANQFCNLRVRDALRAQGAWARLAHQGGA